MLKPCASRCGVDSVQRSNHVATPLVRGPNNQHAVDRRLNHFQAPLTSISGGSRSLHLDRLRMASAETAQETSAELVKRVAPSRKFDGALPPYGDKATELINLADGVWCLRQGAGRGHKTTKTT